ncbi:probable protein phosphatase 2C 55 [Sesamum indicum]|uniref:Protein phosphatase n=1 Tax=Sesamum indicum TaxID=4182 RepID=A0A8M8UPY0_SESIN|nr:probable protein phosphatase 2C 55 [Sesamum indicum]
MEAESAHPHDFHCSDRFLDNVCSNGTAAAAVGRRFESWETSGVFLKMSAASIYIPKDNPKKPRGEDAHFISTEEQTIGVADGVGGWAKFGIDGGEYARQLMMNSVLALKKEPRFNVNPKRVLEEAFNNTTAQGSSTACIITLSGDKLRAVNAGDSGFLVIRNGEVVFRSPTQQHSFNCPYQLGNTKDKPSPPWRWSSEWRRGM